MTARFLPANDYAALKASTRDLVRRCGGATAASRTTRVAQQVLSRYGDTSEENADRFAGIDVVADLEAECGEPIITRELALLAGYDLAPRGERRGCAVSAAAKMVSANGEAIGAILEALADGSISPEEAVGMLPRVRLALEQMRELESHITTIALKRDA